MSKYVDNRNIRVLQFLDAYEKNPCLWNPCLESYKNKTARDEAYMNIIHELDVPSLTIHDVKLKVKSIRTTYTKELRLLTKHKKDGKQYSPKLFWFNRANSFLKKVSLSRDKRLNMPDKMDVPSVEYKPCVINYITDMQHSQSSCDEPSVCNEEEDPTTTHSSAYEFKTVQAAEIGSNVQHDLDLGNVPSDDAYNSKLQQEVQTQVSNATVVNSKCNEVSIEPICISNSNRGHITHSSTIGHVNVGDDEYDLFCRSVAVQLRGITDNYSRSVAKLKIQQILFEAETGHYRNNPCITIPVNQNINNSL